MHIYHVLNMSQQLVDSVKNNTGSRMLPLGFVVFFQGHHGDSRPVLAGHLLVVRPRLQDWKWP